MELLNQVLQAVIGVAVPILGAFLMALLNKSAKEASQRTENERVKLYIDEILNTVSAAVAYTSQTYVDELKKSNSFSVENQKVALSMAKSTALSLLSKDARKYLDMVYGDAFKYLGVLIEEQVFKQKQE